MKPVKRPKVDTRSKSGLKRTRHPRSRNPDQVTEMLKLCLQKVCELQADLDRNEDVHDPETAGYTACAMETLRFLSAQGLAPDHPVVQGLTEKLLQDRN